MAFIFCLVVLRTLEGNIQYSTPRSMFLCNNIPVGNCCVIFLTQISAMALGAVERAVGESPPCRAKPNISAAAKFPAAVPSCVVAQYYEGHPPKPKS